MSEEVPYERIAHEHQGEVRDLHEERYRIASWYVHPHDMVLDAACGTGYGRDILGGHWVGVDKEDLCDNVVADLETWQPAFDFEVFVGFETIEHLEDPTNYVELAKRAGTICLSTPIVPTKHRNPYHKNDYTKEQIESLFADRTIAYYQEQAGIYGVWVFT